MTRAPILPSIYCWSSVTLPPPIPEHNRNIPRRASRARHA